MVLLLLCGHVHTDTLINKSNESRQIAEEKKEKRKEWQKKKKKATQKSL